MLRELQADLLAWVAQSRALLAVSGGGVLRGEHVAVLAGRAGMGSLWLVRGAPWQISPGWQECVAFVGAVRASGGRLVGGLDGEAALLLCGLCGLPAGAPVDSWLEAHPLTGGLS